MDYTLQTSPEHPHFHEQQMQPGIPDDANVNMHVPYDPRNSPQHSVYPPTSGQMFTHNGYDEFSVQEYACAPPVPPQQPLYDCRPGEEMAYAQMSAGCNLSEVATSSPIMPPYVSS